MRKATQHTAEEFFPDKLTLPALRDAAADCHILFIGASENRQLTQILSRLRGLPVLTVSDIAGFCETGGAINLVVSDKRVSLEINPASAERARLQLSSRLLSLARIVRDDLKGTR